MLEEYFDWVTARSRCSMNALFEQLRNDVRLDIAAWEGLPGREGQIVFDPHNDYFTVTKNGRPDAPKVTFRFGDNKEIVIESYGRQKTMSFQATLTLNRERQCRFVVDGQELEGWQVRQMALSPLFFPQGNAS